MIVKETPKNPPEKIDFSFIDRASFLHHYSSEVYKTLTARLVLYGDAL
jgi:hypothetical protein